MSKNSKKFIYENIAAKEELEAFLKEAVSIGSDAGRRGVDVTGGSIKGRSQYTGPLVTKRGSKRYLGDPGVGLSGEGFWTEFRRRLQAFMRSAYPELGLEVGDLGVSRDLAKAADPGGNTARVAGSKHGSGMAQDVKFHTSKYGKYKSFKKMNPKLAADQKLVDAIITFMEQPAQAEIRWGGAFGHSNTSSLAIGQQPKGRGVLEFHHFEIRGAEIPKYFKPYEEELAKIDMGDLGKNLKSGDLTTTKNLAILYKALSEGVITKKLAKYILKEIDWDDVQGRLVKERVGRKDSAGSIGQSIEKSLNVKNNSGASASGDQIAGRAAAAAGQGAASLDAVKNKTTHWNFKLTDGKPADWNIVNFKPEDIVSKGNGMVVADKKALRALDKCASRVSKYKHPPIKLTNQVAPSRNGAYRDPASNKKQGGASKSRHMYGDGFDLWTKDYNPDERINILKNLSDAGFHAFGHGANNIHCDMRPGTSIVQWKYGSYKIPNKKLFIAESIDRISELKNIISEAVSDSTGRTPKTSKTKKADGVDNQEFSVEVPEGTTFVHPVPIYKGKDWSKKLTSPPQASRALKTNKHSGKAKPHKGQDIGVPVGTPLLAYADGTVTTVTDQPSGAGYYVTVEHSMSATDGDASGALQTQYMHMSRQDVKVGQQVTAGQVLGRSGGQPGSPGAGSTTGPHLHFTFKIGKTQSYNKELYDQMLGKASVLKVEDKETA